MKRLTNLFPLQKTLKFELIPQGKTLENIEKKGLITEDEARAENYKRVKKLIDEYHKDFIDTQLTNFHFENGLLNAFYSIYIKANRTKEDNDKLDELKEKLRKDIVHQLVKDDRYKRLNKKELIREDLPRFLEERNFEEEDLERVQEFEKFSTYFTGFYENRENMYSEDDKSTAIAYRLIHENLPKFLDNIESFKKVADSEVANQFETLVSEMEEYLNIVELKEMFSLDYFNMVLTQKQIDVYNAIVGGRNEDKTVKIKGLNNYINEFNQKSPNKKLPLLKVLYKQILSDREGVSWLSEPFNSDKELLKAVSDYYKENINNFEKIKKLLTNLDSFDLNKIYLENKRGEALTKISQSLFSDWSLVKTALTNTLAENLSKNREEDPLKGYKSFSISLINTSINNYGRDVSITDYFKKLDSKEGSDTIIERIQSSFNYVKDILSDDYSSESSLNSNKEKIYLLKEFLDSLLTLYHFVLPLKGSGDEAEKDEIFYGEFSNILDSLSSIVKLYDKVRNYVTKKPYSKDKFKLNFENSTLLAGWDLNKETANLSVLLMRNNNYYLAIMNKSFNKVFEQAPKYISGEYFDKVNYKLLPDPFKMLPKVFFSKKGEELFKPSPHIKTIKDNKSYMKGDSFNIQDCRDLIDYYKNCISQYEGWKSFKFNFSPSSEFNDINQFYDQVKNQGYSLSFSKIPKEYIDTLVKEGKIYLFQLYCKDFSPYSKGTPNIHTLYWKALFDEKNLENVVYKLNGQAELFFRRKSIKKEKPTHPANLPIANKNELGDKKESVFTYDLYKNRRFMSDKFEFHVPISLNYLASSRARINSLVYDYIKETPNLHFIGIDRGERNLLYVSVIDSTGIIKEQFSLNQIINTHKDKEYNTDYKQLLSKREEERDKERKSWNSIETIKELKEGYLSQAIHKIVQLIIKYNAVVILEDLNIGFKRSRQKVESSVYQKFEKMLIDKLNYLVDKTLPKDQEGGLLKAYQLTQSFTSFKKMGKQNGFLFYVPAWNTSNIDPITGFTNLFDLRYQNVEKSQEFFKKFDSIEYNAENHLFKFTFDYSKFTTKAEGSKTKWTICSNGTRIMTFRNPEKNHNWDSKEITINDMFIQFFKNYSIDYTSKDLHTIIYSQKEKSFYEGLLYLMRLTLQMRNSVSGTDIDYILSPVSDASGSFFDSRSVDGNSGPKDADANGAYNIARKGLLLANRIRQSGDVKPSLTITNKEWLSFVQEKPYLKY